MVTLNKIYTRAGDGGRTRLATGEDVAKFDLRVEAYGAVDEANSALGVARLATTGAFDDMLARVQNDLFDLGADLATPEREAPLGFAPLRITQAQVERLEHEIDTLNADLSALTSFVIPGGRPAAAHLHVARATMRRAERVITALAAHPGEVVSGAALRYANRCSDFLFVAARWANDQGRADVLWAPGANR